MKATFQDVSVDEVRELAHHLEVTRGEGGDPGRLRLRAKLRADGYSDEQLDALERGEWGY